MDDPTAPSRRERDLHTPLTGGTGHARADIPLLRVAAGRNAMRHAIVDGPVRIGRDDACTLAIEDPSVSRVHAQLRPDATGFVVEDQGSRNGTFVNTARVQTARVVPGDLLEVGSVPSASTTSRVRSSSSSRARSGSSSRRSATRSPGSSPGSGCRRRCPGASARATGRTSR